MVPSSFLPYLQLLILFVLQTDLVLIPLSRYSNVPHLLRTRRHGPVSRCPISEALFQEYLTLPENSPGRLMIEKRCGTKNIHALFSQTEEGKRLDTIRQEKRSKKMREREKHDEQTLSRQWLATSRVFPGCKVYVEKMSGCNHVRTV
jgi:hypothetical protein